jgi:Fic family protein
MEILALRERDRERIARALGRRTPNGLALLDMLFSQPVVSAKLVEQLIDVSQPTASGLVNELAKAGILREMTGKKRNRLFGYREYLDLFPGAGLRS